MPVKPRVALLMGSASDWDTLQHAAEYLEKMGIAYHRQVVSAHRTPDLLMDFAAKAASQGFKVLIAGAGGAAHLPGMLAAKTQLPVLGVPIAATQLQGLDALLSMVQMPKGIPVATFAIGKPGAINAALFAAAILSLSDGKIRTKLAKFRHKQSQEVLENPDPCPGA